MPGSQDTFSPSCTINLLRNNMKNQSILYGIIGFLVGIVITIIVVSNAINNNMTGMTRMMGIDNQTNSSGSMSNMDRHFIEQMIPHHEDAIAMANLAKDRAQHDEIKTLSQNIKRTQSEEITKMRLWYKDWFGKEVTDDERGVGQGMGRGGMHMGMMGNETDTQRLEEAEDFDKAFIEEMIPHHQMAVMMAQMLLRGTSRPEMTRLGQDIINAQTKEINEMRSWYRAWEY